MAKTAWPTAAYLEARIDALEVSAPGGLSLDDLIDEATTAWIRETNYPPFLATGVNVTRTYNPPAEPYRLHLVSGAVSVASVTVDKTTDSAGTLLTASEDYFLERMRRDGPYEFIQFVNPQYGLYQSIQVVANEGFGATIPTDAWRAVLDKATAEVIRESQLLTGQVVREKQGPVEYDYSRTGKTMLEVLDERWETMIARYRKLPL
jgi:hypothetical protein